MDKWVNQFAGRLSRFEDIIYYFWVKRKEYHKSIEWFDMPAGTSYYLMIGFLPFLVFFINVLLFVMASEIDLVQETVSAYLPEKMAVALEGDIQRIIEQRSPLWMMMGAIFGAYSFEKGVEILTRVADTQDFETLGERMNNPRANFSLRLKSILFVMGLVLTIVALLGLTVFGNALVHECNAYFALPDAFFSLWNYVRYPVPFAMMVIWLTFFYTFAPSRKNREATEHATAHAIVAAVLVTLIWLVATAVYSWFMMFIPSMGAAYGPLVGLIILFIWFNYLAQAIIFGVEFLRAWKEGDRDHFVIARK